MKRKPIPKKTRQQVYDKYNGHCAYCGKAIDIKDMQVDHVVSYGLSIYSGTEEDRKRIQEMVDNGSINALDNLMPACRMCNFYKSSLTLEEFRTSIFNELSHTCVKSFQVRLAIQFGMIEYHPWDGKFYFEKCNEKDNDK